MPKSLYNFNKNIDQKTDAELYTKTNEESFCINNNAKK